METAATNNICVVIPAYNVSDTIGKVVQGALQFVAKVWVADDGSKDKTAEQAFKAGAAVVQLGKNQGKGAALKRLFERAVAAGYDAVISMDGDGQHDPLEIPNFIKAHQKDPDAIIVGSRMHARENIPRARYNSMHVARFFISLAANQFVEDTQCGFRVYPLQLIRRMCLTQGRYVTESEILIKAGDMGGRIHFIRIGAIYGAIRSHFRPILDVTAITAYIISYFPLKYLTEGLCANRPDTYYKGNLRDRIAAHPLRDAYYKLMTVLAIIPLTLFFLAMFTAGSVRMKSNFASIRRLGYGFYKISLATHMLPFILVIISCEKLMGLFGIEMRVIDDFINKFYPHLW